MVYPVSCPMISSSSPRRVGWTRPALVLILAGCALSLFGATPSTWENLDTCDALRAHLREFRGPTFPEGKWTCDDGVLHSLKGQRVDLITREEYEDFELELDWKVSYSANSGIMYGVSEAGSATFWSGPEMQINDDPHHPDGLTPKTSAGGLYDLIAPARRDTLKPTGEYNHIRIVSRGGHIEHWQNGVKVVEYEWGSPELQALIKQTKFADAPLFMKVRKGHIAFQSEGDEVWFRHIRIRRLDAGSRPSPTPSPTPHEHP